MGLKKVCTLVVVVFLICGTASAKQTRLKQDSKIDKKKMISAKLISDEEIDKLSNDGIKEYLKAISYILRNQ